ncbi:C39 family peptidase [Candidatus Woesebacteria bacterium]|nr:C39 family peptidase [Candidatus Woesebacteria bacterium]
MQDRFIHIFTSFRVFVIVFLLFLSSITPASANEQPFFEDNLDAVDLNEWTITYRENFCYYKWPWLNQNGKLGIIINQKSCWSFAVPNSLSIPENANYKFEVNITFPDTINQDRSVAFKYNSNELNRYALHFIPREIDGVVVYGFGYEKIVAGKGVSPTGEYYQYPFEKDKEYHFEFYVQRPNIRILVNEVGNPTDQTEFLIPESEITFPNKSIGLKGASGGIGYSEVWFDNIKVTLLDENPPEEPKQLDVIDYKQYQNPWGNDLYDHSDSTNPTISRWGCALTSAAMVLDYHGLTVDPRSLNEWLKTQPDGYNRYHGIMWTAVTRYTKLHNKTLEFAYLDYADSTFKSEIESDRPPIIKLSNKYGGNHFIVGKGLTNQTSDFTINDPGSSDHPYLSDANNYWGSSLKIGRFKPTNSDLSYIVAMLNEDFDMTFRKDGNPVDEFFYQEEEAYLDPDDPDNSTEGETLNALWYPKPENGNYSFEVSGDGFYQLDIYYYDRNGNVKMETIYGYLPHGETDTYYLSYNKDSVSDISAHSAEERFFESMERICSTKGIIRNGLCQSIISLTKNAIKIGDRDNIFTAQVLLDLVIDRVNFNTPKNINEQLATYILSVVKTIRQNLFT